MQIQNHKVFSKWLQEAHEGKERVVQESRRTNPKSEARDTISVSERALDIHRFVNTLSQEKDEIRYEKIEKIQEQMKEGRYTVSGTDVVAKLMEGN